MVSEDCYIGDQKVSCPGEESGLVEEKERLNTTVAVPARTNIFHGSKLDNVRNDLVYSLILLILVGLVLAVGYLRVRIFGRTLGEYLGPIWYYVLGAILVVFSQYLFVVEAGGGDLLARLTQALWALMVALSTYKLCKDREFGWGNIFFLAVLYSLLIHGLKVTIRYYFYGVSFGYVLDRFTYGSLLVFAAVIPLGVIFKLVSGHSARVPMR